MNPNDLYVSLTRSGYVVWTLAELRELNLPCLTIKAAHPRANRGSCNCVVRPEGFGTPIVPSEGFSCVADATHAYIL
jgi:hypothetical protein